MFDSVRYNKISENIIDQIRKAIIEGKLKPGDQLSSEKELAEKFKVSKATLRQALSTLEVLGFLEIKKGASGGAFVTKIEVKKARDSFVNYLSFQNMTVENLTDVRLLLEPFIVKQAAEMITKEDLERLDHLMAGCTKCLRAGDETDIAKYRNNDAEFHRIIAGATRNPILMFIIDFIETLMIDIKKILEPNLVNPHKTLNGHQRIYKALAEGDPEKAEAAVIKHISEVKSDLKSFLKNENLNEVDLKKLFNTSMFP